MRALCFCFSLVLVACGADLNQPQRFKPSTVIDYINTNPIMVQALRFPALGLSSKTHAHYRREVQEALNKDQARDIIAISEWDDHYRFFYRKSHFRNEFKFTGPIDYDLIGDLNDRFRDQGWRLVDVARFDSANKEKAVALYKRSLDGNGEAPLSLEMKRVESTDLGRTLRELKKDRCVRGLGAEAEGLTLYYRIVTRKCGPLERQAVYLTFKVPHGVRSNLDWQREFIRIVENNGGRFVSTDRVDLFGGKDRPLFLLAVFPGRVDIFNRALLRLEFGTSNQWERLARFRAALSK